MATTPESLTRRTFLARSAACAVGMLAVGASNAGEEKARDPRRWSLAELQKRFCDPKKHLAAYEYFTAGRGLGTAELIGPSKVTVGQRVQEWVLRFHAPPGGLAPRGYLRFWLPNGTSAPKLASTETGNATSPKRQDDHSAKAGLYADGLGPDDVASRVTVVAGGARIEVSVECVAFYKQYEVDAPSFRRVVRVSLPDGLPSGETVTLRWQDVLVDNSATRWGGDRLVFRVYADHDADGYDEEIAASPVVAKQPGPAARIILRCGSTAVVGEPLRVTVTVLDAFDNPAGGYSGAIEFGLDEGDAGAVRLPATRRLENSDEACAEVFAVFTRPGFYWLKARDVKGGFSALANPVEVHAEEPARRLYWGDIHYHTDYSADARAVAATTTDYEGAYKIGRRRCGLDFMAASDHHGLEQGNYGPDDWTRMQRITNEANEPGRFATLIAAELSDPEGDQIAYFAGESAPFLGHEPESRGYPQNDWRELRRHECIAVPHHFCQSMRPWNWTNYDPGLQPICEIFSNHGRGEYSENQPAFCPHKVATLPGRTWVEQLDRGRHLGAIASSDDHTGHPGGCGLAAVWAAKLTRADIYEALKTRSCYGSTDSRAILHFSANGHEMGEFFTTSDPRTFRIRVAAPTRIQELHILKNGRSAHRIEPRARLADLEWTDPASGENDYYYVRIRLEPDAGCTNSAYRGGKTEFVWSSPIWINSPGKA